MRIIFLSIRARTEAAWEHGASRAASVVTRIRPRVSLASGSVLVLLTLFLPITVDSCGNLHGAGYDLALGRPDNYLPGFLGFVFQSFGRAQYVISLALAAVSMLLLLGTSLWSGLGRKRWVCATLFAVAGTVSLFTLSDYLILQFALLDDWPEGPFGAIRLTVTVVTCLLGLLAILSPGLFWPKRVFAAWLIAFPLALLVLWVSEDVTGLLGWELRISESWFALPMGVYYLTPLLLWYRNGFSRRVEILAQWPRVRLGLGSLYGPAAAANCLLLVYASQKEVWGLVPYVVGIHLISLGYMRLAQRAVSPPPERAASP